MDRAFLVTEVATAESMLHVNIGPAETLVMITALDTECSVQGINNDPHNRATEQR
jgi:hypothetical protein